jgi:O-antigen/teichoic acid export membrane protein
MVLAPTITKYYSQKEYLLIKKKFMKHLTYSAFFGIFLSILLYVIISPLIQFYFSKYFIKETIFIFNLLLIILPLRIISGVINQAHTIATGNAHFSLWTMIPAGLLNIILDFIFIYYYGFIGVVYSTIICFTFAITSFILLYYLKLNKLIKEYNQ